MTLGERIRKEREKRGLSGPDLARLVGVEKQAVWQWENTPGKADKVPNLAHSMQLSTILKIPLELFLQAIAAKQHARQRKPDANEESA